MHYKRLFFYPFALGLLVLAVLACGPADESVQRELGNLPPATQALPALQDRVTPLETDSQIAGAMTVPTPALAAPSGSPQEDSEEEDTPTATPEEDTPTPPPTICVAWPTQEAGDPDTMCLTPESMLPAPTPVYPRLGAGLSPMVEDAEKRAREEVARGLARDASETSVASETISVVIRSKTLADSPAIERWLKAKKVTYRKESLDTMSIYSARVPALLLGEMSKLEAIGSTLWNRPIELP